MWFKCTNTVEYISTVFGLKSWKHGRIQDNGHQTRTAVLNKMAFVDIMQPG